jgi:hypothetical protein
LINRSLILKAVASTRVFFLPLAAMLALSGAGCAAETGPAEPSPPAPSVDQASTESPTAPSGPVETIGSPVGGGEHMPPPPAEPGNGVPLDDPAPDPQPSPWRGPPPPHGQLPSTCDPQPSPWVPGVLSLRHPHHHATVSGPRPSHHPPTTL